MKQELFEPMDFYFDEQGNMVLTRKYLLEQGECCGNGCKHCPYDYIRVAEPMRSKLLQAAKSSS